MYENIENTNWNLRNKNQLQRAYRLHNIIGKFQ